MLEAPGDDKLVRPKQSKIFFLNLKETKRCTKTQVINGVCLRSYEDAIIDKVPTTKLKESKSTNILTKLNEG